MRFIKTDNSTKGAVCKDVESKVAPIRACFLGCLVGCVGYLVKPSDKTVRPQIVAKAEEGAAEPSGECL